MPTDGRRGFFRIHPIWTTKRYCSEERGNGGVRVRAHLPPPSQCHPFAPYLSPSYLECEYCLEVWRNMVHSEVAVPINMTVINILWIVMSSSYFLQYNTYSSCLSHLMISRFSVLSLTSCFRVSAVLLGIRRPAFACRPSNT